MASRPSPERPADVVHAGPRRPGAPFSDRETPATRVSGGRRGAGWCQEKKERRRVNGTQWSRQRYPMAWLRPTERWTSGQRRRSPRRARPAPPSRAHALRRAPYARPAPPRRWLSAGSHVGALAVAVTPPPVSIFLPGLHSLIVFVLVFNTGTTRRSSFLFATPQPT